MSKDVLREPISVIRKFTAVDRMHHTCVDGGINQLGFDVHRTQHIMLMYLSHEGGVASQKQIAEQFGISAAAVATSLKNLEAKGYIERKSDNSDSRRNLVAVSEKGKEIVEKSHLKFNATDRAMIEGITTEELEVFESVLDKMIANLREHAKKIGVEVRK